MATVRVKWLEKLQFVGIGANRHTVVMSAPDEENNVGITPGQLMLVALGGCTAYDVVNILSKKRQRLTDLEVLVTGEQAPDPPWALTRVHLTYRLRGRGLNEKAVQDAIELSKTKYCSVGATIAVSAEITYDFTIEEET
jgi:putative redox protein